MADSDVLDEEKLSRTFLQRGKAFEFQETELMDYVAKQNRRAQERHDRLIVRREEEANRKQLELELAAIKEREETARQTAKEQEETARQKELEETKRHAQEEETKRQAQAHAHNQASAQRDDKDWD